MGPDHVCPWWLCYTFDNPLRRLIHKPEKIFAPLVKPGMRVLDAGCGMGYFSLGLARLVGPEGRVVSVDLQPRMLGALTRRARRAGLSGRIETRQCSSDSLGLSEGDSFDFALSFWMAHETPDQKVFFKEVHSALRSGGSLLVTEPAFHVRKRDFEETLGHARAAGFEVSNQAPRVFFSRSALLSR